jgi:ribosomal subunit interface protein
MSCKSCVLSLRQQNRTKMNDLPVHIMSHGIELSFALRNFIEKKISRLSRFAGDILSAEVVLHEKSGSNGLFSVSARLALPGRDVHGNAVHENFYAAINQLVARLARLSRKRKTRFEKRIRRAGRLIRERIPSSQKPMVLGWSAKAIRQTSTTQRKNYI